MSLLDNASAIALRYLDEAKFTWLRERYFALRTKLSPVLRALHGSFDAAGLERHLRERIGDFEIVMVHSSFNRLQPMYDGSALELLQTLMRWCGPHRTLVMPAFYFGDPKLGGLNESFKKNPRFDVRRTPSQMGILTELFRRTRGVRHSRHPIYRVCALGPLAESLTQGHETADWACGIGSPFDTMTSRDTMILGIGKSIEVLTHVHHVEDVMGEAFPVPLWHGTDTLLTLIDDGRELPFTLHRRGPQWRRNMSKLRTIVPPEKLKEWTFHSVPFFAIKARDVTTALTAAAERGVTIYERP